MTNTKHAVSLIDLPTVETYIKEINDAYFDIPFGNTAFQTEMFVIAQQITPARAYRAVGLQMNATLGNLKTLIIEQKLDEISVEEFKEQIQDESVSRFERARAEIKVKNVMDAMEVRRKLVNDSFHELQILYKHFSAMPQYTREQFEAEERLYFEQSLQRQTMGITGAKEAIVNMMEDFKNLSQFQSALASIPRCDWDSKLASLTKECLKIEEPAKKEIT